MKNIQDRHGGDGTALTPEGITQARVMRTRLSQRIGDRQTVVGYHDVPQVRETVAIVAGELSWSLTRDERLRGLNLGTLAGLTRSEASISHPDAAARLEKWRAGGISITDLQLPDAEPVAAFESRVRLALDDLIQTADVVIAVVTRSTFIMVTNILTLFDSFSYDEYKPYAMANAAISEWRVWIDKPVRPEYMGSIAACPI